MWGGAYWGHRYWAAFYWPGAGGGTPPTTSGALYIPTFRPRRR